MMTRRGVCLAGVLAVSCAPAASSVEAEFFRGDYLTRDQRIEPYPLDQQYRIFLYGNQVIHPPATGLAGPIAKKGKVAADYILEQLAATKNQLDHHDALVVFQRMQWGGYFDVCGTPGYLEKLRANEARISRQGSREIYREMLSRLCR